MSFYVSLMTFSKLCQKLRIQPYVHATAVNFKVAHLTKPARKRQKEKLFLCLVGA